MQIVNLFVIVALMLSVVTACGTGLTAIQTTATPAAGQSSTASDTATQSKTETTTQTSEATTESTSTETTTSAAASGNSASVPETKTNKSGDKNPLVTITMNDGKTIYLELYPEIAPNTVNNFISLVSDGFYDGVIFHRVIPGFMIQGGDPEGIGMGGPGYAIAGEFSNNGFENNLGHSRGILSMARTQIPDSAGSQFFIMVEDSPFLDGEYAAFGEVIGGIETADAIVSADRDGSDKPYEDQVMKSVTVDTFGVEYPDPETLPE